jgi:hypothetical protein
MHEHFHGEMRNKSHSVAQFECFRRSNATKARCVPSAFSKLVGRNSGGGGGVLKNAPSNRVDRLDPWNYSKKVCSTIL